MNKISKKTTILKYAYFICIVVNWISRLLPYRVSPSLDIGFDLFIQFDFSWIGMLINFLPLMQLHRLNNRMAITYGLIGCMIMIIFQILLLPTILNPYIKFIPNYGYFIGLLSLLGCCYILGLLSLELIFRHDIEKVAIVKKTILDYITFLTRLKLREISELTRVDQSIIVDTIRSMIENQEIYAKYYKSSNSVVFSRLENMDKIDDLMEKYNTWEKNNIGKMNSEKIKKGA